jgi:hypothetical protein
VTTTIVLLVIIDLSVFIYSTERFRDKNSSIDRLKRGAFRTEMETEASVRHFVCFEQNRKIDNVQKLKLYFNAILFAKQMLVTCIRICKLRKIM